jgi:hypothetical protein
MSLLINPASPFSHRDQAVAEHLPSLSFSLLFSSGIVWTGWGPQRKSVRGWTAQDPTDLVLVRYRSERTNGMFHVPPSYFNLSATQLIHLRAALPRVSIRLTQAMSSQSQNQNQTQRQRPRASQTSGLVRLSASRCLEIFSLPSSPAPHL